VTGANASRQSTETIKHNMRPGNKNRTDAGDSVVGSSHIGFQVLHEHEQDGIPSRWQQQAAVDGDLPPARPARNDRPKWLTQVFQPASLLDAPTAPTAKTSPVAASSKKGTARTLSSRQQQQQGKDMPDCQPSRPMRQRSGSKFQAVLLSGASSTGQPTLPVRQQSGGKCQPVVSSDASNTHATEDITDHDTEDDEFDDDISDITPEDYSETSLISDSQSYIRCNNNSKSIPQEVSPSKALDTGAMIPKTTVTLQPAVNTKNAAPVSSIENPAARTPEPEPVDAAQEATATKYRRMLQMKVPKEAVRQKMMVDGVDPEIVRLVVGESATAPAFTKKDPTPVVVGNEAPVHANGKDESKNESKLVALHWTPLSGKDLDHSVWMVNNRQSITAQKSDFYKLVELFRKKPKTCLPLGGKKLTSKSRSPPRANLLDPSRCNNVAISLKQFKTFSHEDLRDIIAFLDPMQRIRGERVELLRDILPTVSEARKVTAYDGVEDCLVSTEIWFRRVACIQRLERKVEVIRTMEVFTSETAVLEKKLRLLSQVCQQVMSSEKLQNLLDMVLQVGNTLNAGTRTGEAAGFKFDSLTKLTQTKSSDGKITVIDFVVASFATHGQRDSLKLLLDFPECHAAARLPVSDLVNQVTALQRALQICEDELKALKDELSDGGVTQHPKRKAAFRPTKKSESGDARGSLMASLLSRRRGKVAQEAQSKDTGIEKNSKTAESSDSGTPAIDTTASNFQQNSLQGGIVRLEAFIRKGKETLVELESSQKSALDACSSLSKYCGEGCGAATASSTLLGILAQFASNVDAALIKFDRQQKAEIRRQKTQVATVPTAQPTGSSETETPASPSEKVDESSGQEKLSLVLLVNEWLNDANSNDRTIEGGMHAYASAKLNAMYDKEKTTGTSAVIGARRAAPWRSDLVMERDGKMEQ
jgi:hypothetical protein